MIKKLTKFFTNIDLLFIEQLMKKCNECNVKEFKMNNRTNSVEITFK